MLGARRHSDKRARQAISNDKAVDSSQQVVTHIVVASSTIADVYDAVLERHNIDGVSFMDRHWIRQIKEDTEDETTPNHRIHTPPLHKQSHISITISTNSTHTVTFTQLKIASALHDAVARFFTTAPHNVIAYVPWCDLPQRPKHSRSVCGNRQTIPRVFPASCSRQPHSHTRSRCVERTQERSRFHCTT